MKIETLISVLFLSLSLSRLSLSLTQEGLYLLQAKRSLSVPDTANYLSDWNPRDPTPCNWTGITCGSSTGPVVSIDLSNLSLSGPFPLFLCRLPSLSSLSLRNNYLNSSLPSSISQCQALTLLNLGENLFSGPIPDTLPDIAGLRFLTVEANSFSGDIPASFGRFRQLRVLNLVNNLLNGSIPDSLGEITSLRELKLAYNPFPPSRLSPRLGNLSNLEHLWMSGCNLVGPVPDELARLSRLRNLELSGNRLTGPIPGVIFEMKRIEQIELFSNSFSGEIPAEGWWRIPGLRRLDASANKLTGLIPDELCKLQLGSLNLEDNQLTGPLPETIAKSPNLFELKLFNNSLNGSLPSELGRNSPLVSIDVSTNQFSGELPQFLCENGVLEQLLVIYNFFWGTFPEVYGKCQTLRRVRLRGNRFSGKFPSEFWGLPHVNLLDIGENLFSGNVSHTIYGASNLSVLHISHNKFSGDIPEEIGFLNKLVEFSASDNELSGPIPSTFNNVGLLGVLDLSNNQLSGIIPDGLGSLKRLNELNLANNSFSGEIPCEIGSFPVLNYLDLSYNQFSGEIPLDLQHLKLNTLNLSYNRLTGAIPRLYANGAYDDSFLGNPGLCGDPPGHCNRKSKGINGTKAWILRSVLTAISLILLVGFLMFSWKCWKLMKSHKDTSIMKWRSFHKLDFSVTEIINCLTEENVFGSGSSGKVYKAELNSGEVVAVKKLCMTGKDGRDETVGNFNSQKDEFETEVETLGKIRHRNIVRLWCCSNASDCKLLVYEYMPNGSLGDVLHSNKGRFLDWPTRFRIASDSADGLSYLHHDCAPPIVHRDVKSNNILLDENFGAKISDFGVAKVIKMVNSGAKSMSVIAGSCGYIAPEYAYTLRVTEKSDIYSFGVVILELLTGKRPIDPELGEKDLITWVCNNLDQKGIDYILAQNIKYSNYKEQICKVLDIGLQCVSAVPTNRPSMHTVVKMLREARTAAAAAVEKPVKLMN